MSRGFFYTDVNIIVLVSVVLVVTGYVTDIFAKYTVIVSPDEYQLGTPLI